MKKGTPVVLNNLPEYKVVVLHTGFFRTDESLVQDTP
jgi:hypothetical protein